MFKRSSESIIYFNLKSKIVTKIRLKKSYLRVIDRLKLAKALTIHQYKLLSFLNNLNFNCPKIYSITGIALKMQYLQPQPFPASLYELGILIASLHKHKIIHNDLNLNNIVFSNNKFNLLDFSLSYFSHKPFDMVSDVYLLLTDLKNKGFIDFEFITAYKSIINFDFDIELSNYLRLRRYN